MPRTLVNVELQAKLKLYANPPYGQGLRCPQARLHVKGEPTGYLQWHAWAEKKSKTHDQERCPGCGMYKVWKRRG